jgi:hypothetical protein
MTLSEPFRYLFIATFAASMAGCRIMAPPAPMMTMGSPATAPAGGAEMAIGLGTGASLFPGGHGTGHGWFGRYRYGLGQRLDLGMDLVGAGYGDDRTLTGKLALRYRVSPHWRIEAGLGAADDSNGKSANADVGVTVGSIRPDWWWDYYGAVRVGGAYGLHGDILGSGDEAPPSDALFIGTAGATIRIQPNIRFVIEGGYGAILIQGVNDVGQALYIGAGLLMTAGP